MFFPKHLGNVSCQISIILTVDRSQLMIRLLLTAQSYDRLPPKLLGSWFQSFNVHPWSYDCIWGILQLANWWDTAKGHLWPFTMFFPETGFLEKKNTPLCIRLATMAFTLWLPHLLNEYCKKSCKIGSDYVMTCFITIITCYHNFWAQL